MPLADTDILDLVKGTLNDLGRLKFNQIATRIQSYEVMSKIIKKDKMEFDSGLQIQRTLMVDYSTSARNVGLHEVDVVNIPDLLQTITIPWRHTTANWAWERRQTLMNRGESKIVDTVKVQRAGAMIGLAAQMENDFWSKPTDSTDKITPHGIKYWIVANATAGFNGGIPSGFSDVAGLSPTTYTRWKNYTDLFTNVTKTDLIRKMRSAFKKTSFKSPIDIEDYRKGNGQKMRIYTNESIQTQVEELAEQQNDNLGRDIASMDGQTTFRGIPFMWVPQLDGTTAPTNPVYFCNYDWFCPVVLKGDYLRETEPKFRDTQHNTVVVHVDLTWNILCTNRREQAVLCTSTS